MAGGSRCWHRLPRTVIRPVARRSRRRHAGETARAAASAVRSDSGRRAPARRWRTIALSAERRLIWTAVLIRVGQARYRGTGKRRTCRLPHQRLRPGNKPARGGRSLPRDVAGESEPRTSARRSTDCSPHACSYRLVRKLLRSARGLTAATVRTVDAVHLASALRIEADELLAYDDRLLAAAAEQGLTRRPSRTSLATYDSAPDLSTLRVTVEARKMAVGTETVQVVMPAMGDSVSEGATVLEWHKHEGDTVVADETIVEISTDKVDAEVPSPASGTVMKIYAAEGDAVAVGAVLAEISINGDGAATGQRRRRGEPDRGHACVRRVPARVRRGARRGRRGPRQSREAATEATIGETIDIVTPAGGESVTEGTILEWSVKARRHRQGRRHGRRDLDRQGRHGATTCARHGDDHRDPGRGRRNGHGRAGDRADDQERRRGQYRPTARRQQPAGAGRADGDGATLPRSPGRWP